MGFSPPLLSCDASFFWWQNLKGNNSWWAFYLTFENTFPLLGSPWQRLLLLNWWMQFKWNSSQFAFKGSNNCFFFVEVAFSTAFNILQDNITLKCALRLSPLCNMWKLYDITDSYSLTFSLSHIARRTVSRFWSVFMSFVTETLPLSVTCFTVQCLQGPGYDVIFLEETSSLDQRCRYSVQL